MPRLIRLMLFASTSLPLLLHAELPQDLPQRVREIVADELPRSSAPAMSVAVVAEGRIVASIAVGFADTESKVPATTQTVFQAASLTKLLTAAIAMHEVESGRTSLDSLVNEVLPDERRVRSADGSLAPVTLRQLLSHSSGIAFHSALQVDPNEPSRTMDEYLAHGLKTIRGPGEKLIYASDGFTLAGWLAARAEGKPYDELAQKVILSPLGMRSSSYKSPREHGSALAVAHESGRRILHANVSAGMPAGALLTTAEDLARFALLCLGRGEIDGKRILRAESVDEMLRLQARVHARVPEGFGLGFAIREIPGRRIAWWDGQLPGAASRLALLPEHNVGVVVLANGADNNAVARVSNRILDLLIPDVSVDREASTNKTADEQALIGFYRLKDMLPPPLSLAERFVNFKIERSTDGIALSSLLFDAQVTAIGDGLFRLEGGMLDGSIGIVDGDRLFFSVLEGERVGPLQSATAWFVYVGTVVLSVSALIVWGLVRVFRRKPRK